jgi:hypothetical protein
MRKYIIISLLCMFFMPLTARFSYNNYTGMYESADPIFEVIPKEYDRLSEIVVDMIAHYVAQGMNEGLMEFKIMAFLNKVGTPTALQLKKDVMELFGSAYE